MLRDLKDRHLSRRVTPYKMLNLTSAPSNILFLHCPKWSMRGMRISPAAKFFFSVRSDSLPGGNGSPLRAREGPADLLFLQNSLATVQALNVFRSLAAWIVIVRGFWHLWAFHLAHMSDRLKLLPFLVVVQRQQFRTTAKSFPSFNGILSSILRPLCGKTTLRKFRVLFWALGILCTVRIAS